MGLEIVFNNLSANHPVQRLRKRPGSRSSSYLPSPPEAMLKTVSTCESEGFESKDVILDVSGQHKGSSIAIAERPSHSPIDPRVLSANEN